MTVPSGAGTRRDRPHAWSTIVTSGGKPASQPPLDRLERLVGDKVEGDAGASLSVGGDRGIVKAKLTCGCAQLDPVSGARARIRMQTKRLVEANGRRHVWHEVDRRTLTAIGRLPSDPGA